MTLVEPFDGPEVTTTVVALIDGENVTLKKYYPEGAQVRLQPANGNFAPIVLDGMRVKIQGVVVSVMRKY